MVALIKMVALKFDIHGGIDIHVHGGNIKLATDIYKHSSKLLTRILEIM